MFLALSKLMQNTPQPYKFDLTKLTSAPWECHIPMSINQIGFLVVIITLRFKIFMGKFLCYLVIGDGRIPYQWPIHWTNLTGHCDIKTLRD